MNFPLLPCPDCRTADHLVPAERPHTLVDTVTAVQIGVLGASATEADLKAWTRCTRCDTLIRQRRGRLADAFSRLFFGENARPGAIIRPKR